MKIGHVVIGLVLAACASSPAPSNTATPVASVVPVGGAPAPSGRTVRILRIQSSAFEPVVHDDLGTAKKWGADPANAMNVLPAFKHILVKAPAGNAEARASARRKAEDIVARLDRGEDFATLAKTSDDPGSAKQGGAYPGRMVKEFVREVRDAYDALRPGQRSPTLVESSFGWHVVAKGPIDDEACVDGHRVWLARSIAERIGRDLAKRLRHVEGIIVSEAIERAFVVALSAERSKIGTVPAVVRMDAATCDGFATIARGEGISWRQDALLVAAITNDERDASEVESAECEEPSRTLTNAEVGALIERARENAK